MKRACLNNTNGYENLNRFFLRISLRGSSDLVKLKYLQMKRGLNLFLFLKISLVVLFLNITLDNFSQVTLTASLNTNTVGMQQQFFATYTLKGGKSQSFEMPDFTNFRLVGQRSQSGGGMTVIVNGQVVSGGDDEQSWTFTLMPTKPGKFNIPAARARVGGSWYSSNSLEVNVINTGQAPATQQAPSQQPTQRNQQQQSPVNEGLSKDDVFLRATASKNSAYVGEPIVISYKIFTRVAIPNYVINKIPSFEGFWSEELLDNVNRPKVEEEIINGQKYTTAIVRRIVVFPKKSGELVVEPLEIEAIARLVRQTQRRSPFDNMDDIFKNFFNDPFFSNPGSFFGSSYEDIKTTVKSNPISIRVRELPMSNRPNEFGGQVGNYNFEAWIDKDRVLVNDVVNLSVKISGDGNLSLLDAPTINFPSSFEVFDPQVEDNIRKTAAGLSGSKTFNFMIIPRKSGKFEIPSVTFSYFNPSTGSYNTLKSDVFKIEVFGADASSQFANIKTSDDIRFILVKPSKFKKINSFFMGSFFYWSVFMFFIVAFAVCLFLMRKHLQLKSNVKELKYRRANKIAKKRMKKAQILLKNNKLDEFYEEVSRSIWEYLSDRFSIQKAELSIDNVVKLLSEKNFDQELLLKLKTTLDFCEYIRFAPGASSSSPNEILEDSNFVISMLEQSFFNNNKRV